MRNAILSDRLSIRRKGRRSYIASPDADMWEVSTVDERREREEEGGDEKKRLVSRSRVVGV